MLAMSRAMGDLALARYGVTGQPDVASYERSPDDQFLIIASDGLWAVMSNQVWPSTCYGHQSVRQSVSE